MNQYNKHNDQNFFQATLSFLRKRFKSLGIIYVVSLGYSIWYMAAHHTYIPSQPLNFGFLWFITFMLAALLFWFILKRLIKNSTEFVIVCAVVAILFSTLLGAKDIGFNRAAACMALGIIASYIPKIKQTKKGIMISWIFTIIAFAGTLTIMAFPKTDVLRNILILLFPIVLYFASNINIKIKLFNFLGALSFGMYAFQCVLQVLEHYGISNPTVLFVVLMTITVIANPKAIKELFTFTPKVKDIQKPQLGQQ